MSAPSAEYRDWAIIRSLLSNLADRHRMHTGHQVHEVLNSPFDCSVKCLVCDGPIVKPCPHAR